MSAWSNQGVDEPVARVLDELDDLRIDSSRLDFLSDYPQMVGGFGTIRVANFDGEIVAVKELRILGEHGDRARVAKRFARELKVWAPLDHPNLLKLVGFNLCSNMITAQFICPFYPLGHIGKYLRENPCDEPKRLSLAYDTALGLRYLHERRFTHGDLKDVRKILEAHHLILRKNYQANVLVNPGGRALLCDYGLSKVMNEDGADSGMTTTGFPMSHRFASPEIVNYDHERDTKDPHDLRSDMWAWGCLFLQIVAGVTPYQNARFEIACLAKIARGEPPADVAVLNLPLSFQNVLLGCWDPDPFARLNIERCLEIITLLQKSEQPWSSMKIFHPDDVPVNSIAFSPNGQLLAAACADHLVRMWKVESGSMTDSLDCRASVYAIAFSPNGQRLACGLASLEIRIWDAIPKTLASVNYNSWSGAIKLPLPAPAYSISFSPDNLRLAVGLGQGQIQIYDGMTGSLLYTLDNGYDDIRGLAFSPDGNWLGFCSLDKILRIQKISSMNTERSPGWPPALKLEEHTDWVTSVAFSPNGSWLASGSRDCTITIWNSSTWKSFTVLRGEYCVKSLAFSPDSTLLASGTDNGRLQIWDMTSMSLVITLEGHTDWINSVAFSPDGRRIASCSGDNTVQVLCKTDLEVSSGKTL